MKLAKWATVAVGALVVFAVGLWLGSSGWRGSPQPAVQAGIVPQTPQSGVLPRAGVSDSGGDSESPILSRAAPTATESEQSRVPLPPARSITVEPEVAVRGNPEAPVTIVEYSDYQ